MSSSVKITAAPTKSLLDENVSITVSNLAPNQKVILKSLLDEEGKKFNGEGHYSADENGSVDCMKMDSHGGGFTGCAPMGLMWSLQPESGYSSGWRVRKKDVTVPHYINLSVCNNEGDVLSECVIEKYYKSDTVQRIPVRQGRIRGTLFIPNNGLGTYPAIIDLYGSTGGLPEYRAALLSSRGFLVLALAFSQHDDLPKDLVVELEYFEEAIDFLTCHKNSFGNNEVGIISISYGATLAQDIALISSKVKAVVLIGAPFFRFEGTKYRGNILPHSTPQMKDVIVGDTMINVGNTSKVAACRNPDAVIDLYKAKHSSFLIIQGADDQQAHPESALQIAQNLTENGHLNYSLFLYEGAGHLIEPPHIPFVYASWHRTFEKVIVSGGSAAKHSRAQELAWAEILNYFRKNLTCSKMLTSKL